MTIPKFIKVLGLDYEICQNEDVAREGSCYGSTHHSTQKIFLDPTNTPQHTEQVFLHELLHALWWQMGLTRLPDFDEKKEEQIVNAMARGLHAVLKDNQLLK